MADYREIPEQIRSFLAGSDATGQRGWDAQTGERAEAYVALVREANDRLRRCAEYLGRGMRSEAVHLAECQPRLLELTEALRLPDPVRWSRACTSHGLPAPPELLTDGLEQIEASFAIERDLEPLLARHRLLALAQAPLKDRLEVLRALAGRDVGGLAWQEGLRLLETGRFKEMRAEAKVAFRSKDRASLERLASELANASSPVPDDLRDGLEKAVNSVRLEAVRKQIMPILARLETALQARDFATASEFLGHWQELIDEGKVALPPDLQQRVRPVVAWVAQEEKRRNAGQKLAAIQPAIQTGQADVKTWLRTKAVQTGLIGVGAGVAIAGITYLVFKLAMRH